MMDKNNALLKNGILKINPKLGMMMATGNIRKAFSFSFARENCLCCNGQSIGAPLCVRCQKKYLLNFESDFSKRCSICGRELLSEIGLCTKCRAENNFSHVDKVLPIFSYRLWLKMLIFQWKMGNRRSLSPIFASIFDAGIKLVSEPDSKTVLVPIPPRPGKIKKRGWDQVDELCGFLERRYGYEVLKVLTRITLDQQKKKDRKQRLDSKGKSYSVSGKSGKILSAWAKRNGLSEGTVPDEAIIIDDVITTGVTVDSCGELLKSIGIENVKVVSLVIVD